MGATRQKAIEIIGQREANNSTPKPNKISDIFATNVFGYKLMKKYLSKKAYQQLKEASAGYHKLDRETADEIADGMKDWAMSRGVTHYTHWFQPLRGGSTAEKHDSFFERTGFGKGLEIFSGSSLIQQEPDASSFPNGGIRNTFEARGYTAWDPSSPAFIIEKASGKTLCIPTVFVAYTGEALDYKVPMLKSLSAIEKASVKVAQYFDSNGMLTQDNNVPFVKTIARVSRSADGKMAEYKLPVEMPALLGAGSEFFAIDKLPVYANGVIKLDELKNDKTMIGYIYGGINSKEANIFWTNEGFESIASPQIFKVYLTKNNLGETHKLNEQSTGSLKLQVRTSTVKGIFKVIYQIQKTTDVKISLYTDSGKKIEEKTFKNTAPGEHIYLKKMKNFSNGGVYMLSVETSYEKVSQKIIVDP